MKLKLKWSFLKLLKHKIIHLITLLEACMENIFQIQLSTTIQKLFFEVTKLLKICLLNITTVKINSFYYLL